ncbi:MocR-like pyridoxine biosynthesis transcription factor PdxR [Parasporobacterium paucivorans]|uniref:GntR family transcriptional regulator / MocR family aminotransferase n=1 Tax=Parasporobacterium paucivorans DSM 15970 TaxID=1122934 RepID=A0A1M6II42_9FIRM|nr:PLP-dependent aminotransferase family protein [Parasporobacterium paucivorans]SHJ34132.1 GntR family transcriptional regulator / MocR family aminotransferase [Parasporobacterium paucivorans DSM 15970]
MIYMDKKCGIPLYEQLFDVLRQRILKGEMKKDSALKPIRVLAEEIDVSNNTVSKVYQQLVAEGYIRSVPGSGYYVEDLEALQGMRAATKAAMKEEALASVPPLRHDFKYENINSASFPWTKWRRYMQNAILEESYEKEIGYECNKGNAKLREVICEYVNNSRGVNCCPDQIIISAGTQYAMDIITNILPIKDYVVGVEDPGYNGMRKIFSNKGYGIRALPMTDSGIDMDALDGSDCNLIYLTPSHQFPTGVTTSIKKRLQILEWAKKNNAYVIENDYDNEFVYGKKPLPSMQSLDEGKVIYLSTLSKVLSPSHRCAYLVLPRPLVEIYEDKYKHYYAALPTYNQKALADFIRDGYLEKHVRKMSLINRRKYEILMRVMKEWLPEEVKLFVAPAGSHILMQVQGCTSQDSLISKMQEKGIGIYGTKSYWIDQENAPENIFMIGYNSLLEEDLEDACIEFACAMEAIVWGDGC